MTSPSAHGSGAELLVRTWTWNETNNFQHRGMSTSLIEPKLAFSRCSLSVWR